MYTVEYGSWLDTGLVLSKDLGYEPYLDGTVSPGWELWHSPPTPMCVALGEALLRPSLCLHSFNLTEAAWLPL